MILALIIMRSTLSGSGNHASLGAGVAPKPTATTTTVSAALAPAQVLDSLNDPFAQVVVAPRGAQSVQAVPSPVAALTVQTTVAPSTTTIRGTTTTTTTTTRPAAAASAAATTTETTTLAGVALSAPPTVPTKTVAGTAGPVAVPGAMLTLCERTAALTCYPTPAATSVSLTALATIAEGAVTPPTIVTGECSNGQGVALVVSSGSSATTITGAATVTSGGTPTVIPLGTAPTPPNQTVVLSACVPPGVGTPGVTGAPAPGQLGNIVGSLLQLVSGLLGPAASGTPAR